MEQQNQHQSAQSQEQQRSQPVYDINQGGHFGASAALSNHGLAPVPEFYSGTWANVSDILLYSNLLTLKVNQGLHGNYKEILTTYWQHIINHLETEVHDYKLHQLPLARIKKVMKADPEVKMISAEAPILFAKGCDIFITELTMRAWIHAEENKRRTLQRSDIASALSKSDMFDFLIDIVPREDASADRQKRGVSGPVQPAGQQVQALRPPPYMGQSSSAGQEAFGQRQAIYTSDVHPGSGPSGYVGPPGQIYGEMEEIYGYSSMPSQQQPIYQVSSQSQPQQQSQSQSSQQCQAPMSHDPTTSHNNSDMTQQNFATRNDTDAEGEQDFDSGVKDEY
ncbi:Nuclear transcription factor Y subunit C-1 [Golovinomyces cichoracearum]|uniref:Nuclear transcription factor Y subunit C-1 n=1 Tax=Golovinomyces cichoracearum TaxID=62708 RepID=A0A420J101_9PEZI|nr:Nuclear transcription factor Y subunit C-1 [Golovinomyces cichoracearum]